MILCLGTTPSMARVMFFKSLVIDDVNRAIKVVDHTAGKSINVAKVAHALDEPTMALGLAGGVRGRQLLDSLAQDNVPHEFVPIESETRLCVTLIDQSTRQVTELVQEHPPAPAEAFAALLKVLDGQLTRAKVLVLSGTVAAGGPDDFYAQCVKRARQAGVKTIVDAAGVQLRTAIEQKPDLIKPNRAELSATLGTSIDTEPQLLEAMHQMLSRGCGAIVVSQGADGLIAMNAQGTWRISVPKIDVVSPIGSGDSLAAGLATGISRGLPFDESCKLGAACGVVNALSPFTGHVTREQVETMITRIIAQKIA